MPLVMNPSPHTSQVLDSGVKVASNQVQYSVVDRLPEIFMAEVCRKKNIAILPYGVLVGGQGVGCEHSVGCGVVPGSP